MITNPRLQAVRITASGASRNYIQDQHRVTAVPLAIRRRQNRKVLTPPSGSSSALAAGGLDAPMIKTLGKAFYWLRQLESGKYHTIAELARSQGLEPGWVAEVLRLTLLAPDIIESILAGQQARHLNLQSLRGRGQDWPRNWMEQQSALYANVDD
ncbi:hypothetical protein ACMHYJ_06170 [Castellaniella hirudinis]|uniref:hypothetical protein n=1 Tax=Castellaniella hirudinis TaxID=1144617 RepID=UPI0039C10FCE